jgi:geranylgeranyl reductase family protein
MIKTEVCIVGAGPGGCTAALKLSQLGIPCFLVDKAVFPRDKICGDAFTNKVKLVLGRIDPGIIGRFEAATEAYSTVWGARFISPNGQQIDLPFQPNYDITRVPKQSYTIKRLDFDHWLTGEVKRRNNIFFHEGISIEKYERTSDGYLISNADGSFVLHCKLLIVANGAHSRFSRHHAGLQKDEMHHAAGVRAYFRNVTGLHPDGFIEFHFLKKLTPGYLWIFGLPNGQANVGLFMRSDLVSKRRLNLNKLLQEIISTDPKFRERFQGAEQLGKTMGYALPLGSKPRPLSGDHYLLVGDAAHLIDPFSGEGIGNAMYSGSIAAEQAAACLATNDFSASTLHAYDKRIARILGKDMKLSLWLQRLATKPWLLNFVVNSLALTPWLVHRMIAWYNRMNKLNS